MLLQLMVKDEVIVEAAKNEINCCSSDSCNHPQAKCLTKNGITGKVCRMAELAVQRIKDEMICVFQNKIHV